MNQQRNLVFGRRAHGSGPDNAYVDVVGHMVSGKLLATLIALSDCVAKPGLTPISEVGKR
jgi:hypothetical protein